MKKQQLLIGMALCLVASQLQAVPKQHTIINNSDNAITGKLKFYQEEDYGYGPL